MPPSDPGADPDQRDADSRRRKRPSPPLTEAYLRREMHRYLQRWWPSKHRMHEVLMRRVRRCVEGGTGSWDEGRAMVDKLVDELVEKGTLDDRRFALAHAERLHRRGTSRRAIRWKLRKKGVDSDIAKQAVERLEDELRDDGALDPELARAIAYVRRRRLGPMRRDPDKRRERRKKDLAAVARAGFPYGVAKRVIDAEDLDDLEARAEGR